METSQKNQVKIVLVGNCVPSRNGTDFLGMDFILTMVEDSVQDKISIPLAFCLWDFHLPDLFSILKSG